MSVGFVLVGFGDGDTVHFKPFAVLVQTSAFEPALDLALTFLQLAPTFGPDAAEAGDAWPSMIVTTDKQTTLAATVTRRANFVVVKPVDLTATFHDPIPPSRSAI